MRISPYTLHRQAIVLLLIAVAAFALTRQSSIRQFLLSAPAFQVPLAENNGWNAKPAELAFATCTTNGGEVSNESSQRPGINSKKQVAPSSVANSKLKASRSRESRSKNSYEERERIHGNEKEEEPKQDQPDEAMKWRMGSMVDETGKIPEGAEMRAWLHAKQMPIDSSAWPSGHLNPIDPVAGINPAGWQWLGPGNIGGRVRAIVIHPNDPQTLWLGSVSGGIWKTTDGGANWAPLADFMANLAVSSMVIDPTNPNILYAGTGEGYFNFDSIRGAGIFKTTDGGATWNQLPSTATPDWFYVDRLAISPVNSQIILAATRTGIWRSTDGGTTWTRRLSQPFMFDVNFHPTDENLAIASGDSGVARYSTDGGLTWNLATGISGDRVEVAYARSNPAIVYASVDNSMGQVYKSTNGGQSYSLVSVTQGLLADQGWYDNAIWVDPTNPDNVVVGGITLFKSTNGGVNFSQFGGVHADQHIIVEAPGFDGSSIKTVYFGNDGGIYRTTDINAGFITTTTLNNNLGITQFYGGAVNVSSGRIIGGTQDNGTLRYTGNTQLWNFMAGGDGGWCASDPNDPNYFYGEFQWLQLHRSSNGGASSFAIYAGITDAVPNGTTNFIAPFILDPNNSNTLLAGGANLWRTTNAKGSPLGWVNIKTTIGSNISAIAVAKGNSDIVWVGHNNGSVYVSTNGTATSPTWTQVDTNSPSLPNRRITRIIVDPTNSSRVYVTIGGFSNLADNVWRSDNGGASWTNSSNNLPLAPVRTLAVWEQNPNFLYVGTEVGVFASSNGGASWSPSNDGPTNCSVDELFWMGNTLIAATHGRGMFSINISTGQPPDVNITNPIAGANFSSGANITIDANASDPDGTIAKVDFFAGSNLIGTDMNSPYSFTWISAPGGPHVLTARATDNSGDTTVSSPINITVAGGTGNNDNFANAQPLSGETGVVTGSNLGATKEPGEPNHHGNPGGASVWYTWQAPTGGTVAITTAGSTYDTLLAVYTGTSVNALTFVASNDDEQGVLTSRVDFTPVAGQIYRIAVDGYNAGTGPDMGTIVLTLAHGSITPSLQFTFGAYAVTENGEAVTINVFRSGPTSAAAAVDYRTSDAAGLNNCSVVNGIASARCDYTSSVGTLRFAANETSKTIAIPIVNDSYAEGNESFTFTLSNALGSGLGAPATATITINDNEGSNGPNPIDGTAFFVRQQYLDFLNREPDPGGYAAWQQLINNCPVGDTSCDRIHVSSAFFRSPEFQDRGYFVYRFYPAALVANLILLNSFPTWPKSAAF